MAAKENEPQGTSKAGTYQVGFAKHLALRDFGRDSRATLLVVPVARKVSRPSSNRNSSSEY
jgi:hypothetical protein